MAGMGGNGWKRMEISQNCWNGWKWLEMAGKDLNSLNEFKLV